jgi:hypothetical protein
VAVIAGSTRQDVVPNVPSLSTAHHPDDGLMEKPDGSAEEASAAELDELEPGAESPANHSEPPEHAAHHRKVKTGKPTHKPGSKAPHPTGHSKAKAKLRK